MSNKRKTKDKLPSPPLYYWFVTLMTNCFSMWAYSHRLQENIFFEIPIQIRILHALYRWYNNNTFKHDPNDRFWLNSDDDDDDVAHAPGLHYLYSVGVGNYDECCRSCRPCTQQQVFHDGAFGRFLHVFILLPGDWRRYNLYKQYNI